MDNETKTKTLKTKKKKPKKPKTKQKFDKDDSSLRFCLFHGIFTQPIVMISIV